jgi:serine/threonine protein kinase
LSFNGNVVWFGFVDSETSPTAIGDGRYAIDRRVGVGGGGAVYLAQDTLLNRWVAIKKVMGGLGHDDGLDAFREARQLASLQHPNIVTLYDFLSTDGELFVVMEFVAGQNIDELAEPMEGEFFMDFARQCLEALAAAHSIGMVHRDIKPGNIMLAALPSGGFQAKLLDFGMAKVMAEPSLQTMDHSGSITGSIFMISPEQLSRQPIDHRSDLYSLGCVFYQALVGRPPFQGADVPALIAAHLQHDFLSLSTVRPDLPPKLALWVEKLFSFSPDDRPSSAAEALQELAAIRKPAPPPRPDNTGKPSLSNPLAPAAAKKKKAPPKNEPEDPSKPERVPFHRTTNFVIAMAALGAVCLTIVVLALTGHLGGDSAPKPTPFAKKKTEPAPVEKTSFRSNERGEIQDMVGKRISVSGTIDRFEEDLQQDARKDPMKGRFLLFKNSGPRDVMVYFAPKTESSAFALKRKFVGQKIRATGTVQIEGNLLLLDMASMNDLELTGEDPAPAAPAN